MAKAPRNALRAAPPPRRAALALLCGIGAVALPASARAQGIDAHGLTAPPPAADPLAPLVTPSTASDAPKAGMVEILGELSADTLVERVQIDAGDVERYPIVGTLGGMRLSARSTLSRRLSFGLAAPVYFAASGSEAAGGPALGDALLWVPVGLALPREDGTGPALSLALSVDFATGNADRFLGDENTTAGLMALYGQRFGRARLDLGFGFEGRGWGEYLNLEGGPSVRTSAALGVALRDDLALHLELNGRASGATEDAALPELPTDLASPYELMLTARGGADDRRVGWAVGVGRGVTGGAGASAFRATAGVHVRVGALASEPVALEPVTVVVMDGQGRPVSGATLFVGDAIAGRTGTDGRALVTVAPGERIRVEAAGFTPGELVALESGGVFTVAIAPVPTPVSFAVRDQQGNPVDATLTVRELPDADVSRTDAGVAVALPPGTWTLEVSAPGKGTQARTVAIPEGRVVPVQAEVLLAEAHGDDAAVALTVSDPDGAPLDGVRVLVDGAPLGETATGGALAIAGLAAGGHKVQVDAEGFQAIEDRAVTLTPNAAADLALVLRRQPGGVRVRVLDAAGQPVPDATVRWSGPTRLASTAIGDTGERIFQLRPGDWSLLVVSPRFGLQERELRVPADRTDLTEVEITLQPAEEGSASLTLRVVDPDGEPVADARVLLDGRAYGTTTTGGSVRVDELLPGPRTLALDAPRMRPVGDVPVDLVEGMQERVLTMLWEPGTARFRVRTPEAPVDDGAVRAVGPAPVDPLPLDSQGEAWASLAAGDWNAVVASPSAGIQERELSIPPDSTRLHDVEMVLMPEGGFADLAVRVTGPDGAPVDAAEVLLGGTAVGATTDGALQIAGLGPGRRQVEVRAPAYAAVTRTVDLAEGDNAVDVALGWGVGAVRVVVEGPDGPATDAVLRGMGDGPVGPLPVRDDGSRLVALAPGAWQVLAVSSRYGIAEQAVQVPAEPGLTEVTFTLDPVGAGEAELLVRVLDEDGAPLGGAAVSLDGVKRATTSAGGVAILDGLDPGVSRLEVSARDRAAATLKLDLDAGMHERMVELPYVPRPVDVVVTDAAGAPVDAQIALLGPVDVPAARAGSDGRHTFALRPGTWSVMASTDALGMQRVELELAPGADVARVELVLAKEAKVELTAGAVVIREQVPFDFDRATLTPASGPILDEVANTLLAHPEVLRVEVQGHTDNVGGVAYNYDLSSRRADAVVAALVSRGVPQERLVARGFGPTRPLGPNDTPAGQAANRRVQFDIVETAAP